VKLALTAVMSFGSPACPAILTRICLLAGRRARRVLLRESANRNGFTGWNGISAVKAVVLLSGASGAGGSGGERRVGVDVEAPVRIPAVGRHAHAVGARGELRGGDDDDRIVAAEDRAGGAAGVGLVEYTRRHATVRSVQRRCPRWSRRGHQRDQRQADGLATPAAEGSRVGRFRDEAGQAGRRAVAWKDDRRRRLGRSQTFPRTTSSVAADFQLV
jgi:hypothetical protein